MATTNRVTRRKREQLCHEHSELETLVATLHRTLAERHETPQRVSQLFDHLVERIGAHFKDEEAAGLFEEMVSKAPERMRDIEALRTDHETLMQQLLRLEQLATTAAFTPELWATLETGFHHFTTDMCHHETRENNLLVDVYEDDLGSKD